MILGVTITFWVIIVVCAINVIAYMFEGYHSELPMWGRMLNIFWNVWVIFVMLISLGII